jgi:hypothetical protein
MEAHVANGVTVPVLAVLQLDPSVDLYDATRALGESYGLDSRCT